MKKSSGNQVLRMLSLFSGCGGMDLGFEGEFICHRKSVPSDSGWIGNIPIACVADISKTVIRNVSAVRNLPDDNRRFNREDRISDVSIKTENGAINL